MPNERQTDHRLAPGWITSAALLAGSYRIVDLPVVSDQIVDNFTLVPWLAPIHPSETALLSDKDTTLVGSVKQYGFRQLHPKFSYWTFGMVGTFKSTFYTTSTQAAQVTYGGYDDADTFQAIQCYLSPLRLPGDSGSAYYGGWNDVILELLGGALAP